MVRKVGFDIGKSGFESFHHSTKLGGATIKERIVNQTLETRPSGWRLPTLSHYRGGRGPARPGCPGRPKGLRCSRRPAAPGWQLIFLGRHQNLKKWGCLFPISEGIVFLENDQKIDCHPFSLLTSTNMKKLTANLSPFLFSLGKMRLIKKNNC